LRVVEIFNARRSAEAAKASLVRKQLRDRYRSFAIRRKFRPIFSYGPLIIYLPPGREHREADSGNALGCRPDIGQRIRLPWRCLARCDCSGPQIDDKLSIHHQRSRRTYIAAFYKIGGECIVKRLVVRRKMAVDDDWAVHALDL
jgi:hypothetical protein